MKHKIIIAAFVIITLAANLLREGEWKNSFYKFDISGYHLYLPAVFIYNDLKTLSFFPDIDSKYHVGDYPWYGIAELDNGNRLNKYSMGMAIMELPFFLIAHCVNIIEDYHPIDGYAQPYAYGSIISTIFWSALGLIYIRRLLKPYYSDNVIALTLIAIGFGTNLYAYNAYSQGLSHPYSFCLFAAGLFYTDQWYRSYKRSHLFLIALIAGLITIIRPLNGLFVIIPLFWRIANWEGIKARIHLFASKWKVMAIAVLLFTSVLFILFGYWKYVTGNWLYYSYGKESFIWSSPRILQGLFGFRKGWFIYSPVVFIAMLGFYRLWKTQKEIVPVFIVFLLIHIYATFSWWCWWYGGGFGARTLIDILPIMALPLGALCTGIFSKRHIILKTGFTVLIVLLSGLSMLQAYQSIKNIIHYDRTTWAYYWRVFGVIKVETLQQKDFDLLLDIPTYEKEYDRINGN